ncbi:swi5-dependent recombination DNA repair protein 1 homolog isoform X2 [Stigmatopora nigra]
MAGNLDRSGKTDLVKQIGHLPHSKAKPHQKLSTSLKERLKRTRRSFTSPFSVAKRLCVDEDDNDHQLSTISQNTHHDGDVEQNISRPAQTHPEDLTRRRDQLNRDVKDKTETLRRLRMVKMYRSKNNLEQLQTLIDKWRNCAQQALYELQSAIPVDGRKASMSQFIDFLGLDENILHFNRAEDDFSP